MGSLIRATNLWGYPDLVRELGGDPKPLLARFQIPIGIEREPDAFVLFRSVARLLEATAEELDCPDFGLRLSRWQGLDILGPIAVIARNAQTVRDGLTAVARYLYVHSPALKLELETPTRGARPGVHVRDHRAGGAQLAAELRAEHGQRGPDHRPPRRARGSRSTAISFLHEQIGPASAYEEALGCPVRFGQSRCGFEVSDSLARAGDRQRRPGDPPDRHQVPRDRVPAHRRLPHRSGGRPEPAASSRRSLHDRGDRRTAGDASAHLAATPGGGRRPLPGGHRRGATPAGRSLPRRAALLSRPGLRDARVRRAEQPQPRLPALVRQDAASVPSRSRRVGLGQKRVGRGQDSSVGSRPRSWHEHTPLPRGHVPQRRRPLRRLAPQRDHVRSTPSTAPAPAS